VGPNQTAYIEPFNGPARGQGIAPLLRCVEVVPNCQPGADVGKILRETGAEVIFSGQCRTSLIGGAEWDRIVLDRYPNSRALLQIAQSAEYQAISGNRSSGLEGPMNIVVFEG
jgi:uncharacterized protein (DUF1330 family)